MSTYTVNRAKHASLAANTMDTVVLGPGAVIEVANRGSGYLFLTVDGKDVSVNGDNAYVVGPTSSARVQVSSVGVISTTVKLICSVGADYSVSIV